MNAVEDTYLNGRFLHGATKPAAINTQRLTVHQGLTLAPLLFYSLMTSLLSQIRFGRWGIANLVGLNPGRVKRTLKTIIQTNFKIATCSFLTRRLVLLGYDKHWLA